MERAALEQLPDELLTAIVFHLPPLDTLSFGCVSRRANAIATEHLVWRRHCLQRWKYWNSRHEIDELRSRPPAQVRWRQIFNERRAIDEEARATFEMLLLAQRCRIERCESISDAGYDVKDLLLSIRDTATDDDQDVLARRYFANSVLGQIHRRTALEKWGRLQKQQMVRLEEVLGAYDLFVLGGRHGDLHDIDKEFERLANEIRSQDEDWNTRSTRQKAIQIAAYLREAQLVGNPNEDDYHALRNNFISLALFTTPHTSLPLQSVAIYCAIARRLGVLAKPSNYPHHVHAVIEAPPDQTLDGKPRTPDPTTEGFDPETMHLDPWRSSDEITRSQLTLRLSQMGAPRTQFNAYLGSASTLEVALRTGHNIMNSVQEARDRARSNARNVLYPDIDEAWYSMLWSMMILGDVSASNTTATLRRRRQCLPFLAESLQAHFPEDIRSFEQLVAPCFANEREFEIISHLVSMMRTADRNAKAPSPRSGLSRPLIFRVGQYFQHRRYEYEGFIIGWDPRCTAEERWMAQMHIDDLPRGRDQPFYNIVADDKSTRYVAEDNIHALTSQPCDSLMNLAGRYFKRWDAKQGIFINNIRDEYPDD